VPNRSGRESSQKLIDDDLRLLRVIVQKLRKNLHTHENLLARQLHSRLTRMSVETKTAAGVNRRRRFPNEIS
jgi:hypothetical protein